MNLIQNEPVLTAIYTLIVAARVMVMAFGVHMTDDQVAATDGFVLAALGLGLIIRNKVTPNRNIEAVSS
jgi:hypothetical protein